MKDSRLQPEDDGRVGCSAWLGGDGRLLRRPSREDAMKVLNTLEVEMDDGYEHPEYGRRVCSIPRRALSELTRRNGLTERQSALLIHELVVIVRESPPNDKLCREAGRKDAR
jgi:hypothetical protein